MCVMPLALSVHMCCDVASLQLVCVVRPLYRPLCFTSGRSVMFLRFVCSGGCLGSFSAGGPPCVGYFRNLVRGRPIAPWF